MSRDTVQHDRSSSRGIVLAIVFTVVVSLLTMAPAVAANEQVRGEVTMQSSSVFAGEVWGTDHARHVDTTIQDLAVSAQASSVNTVSITINDQLTAGDQIDIASYTLGSSGTNISIWTLKNGSPDENLGFVSLSSPSGAVTITLSKPVTNAQTIVAAVHDGNATRTDNILASDSATIIFDGVVVIGNQPAKDTDGDGQLEDVDGDGKLP